MTISPVQRERIAFWGEVLTACSMTVVAIVVASRLGYREAVRFAQLSEQRQARNLMRAMERELAANEHAMRRGAEDWHADAFRNLHIVTDSFERAKESDAYFRLNPATTTALSAVYGERLTKTIAGIREHRGGPVFRLYAMNVWYFIEKAEAARPLLARDLAAAEQELSGAGIEDVAHEIHWPADPVVEMSPAETEAARLPASAGWERAAVASYNGPVAGLSLGRNLTIPALPRGPVLITFGGMPPQNAKAVRLWLCFAPRAPTDRSLAARDEEERLRRMLSCDAGPGSLVLSIPFERWSGEVIDPNRPLDWRWIYGFIEDDSGARHFLGSLESWKVGKDEPWSARRTPKDNALVLPKGYLK